MSGLNVSQQTDNLASVTIFNDIVKVNQNSPIFPVNCLSSLTLAPKYKIICLVFLCELQVDIIGSYEGMWVFRRRTNQLTNRGQTHLEP